MSLARRRRDHRPRWSDIPECPDDDPDYDRDDMMVRIDAMEPAWRDLVNEHGFTAVLRCLMETRDVRVATIMLEGRRHRRQIDLAEGRA